MFTESAQNGGSQVVSAVAQLTGRNGSGAGWENSTVGSPIRPSVLRLAASLSSRTTAGLREVGEATETGCRGSRVSIGVAGESNLATASFDVARASTCAGVMAPARGIDTVPDARVVDP